MIITCPQCKVKIDKPTGEVNRAKKGGKAIHCGKSCAGLTRRKEKTKEQKKQEKRLYDMQYRAKNGEVLKEKKRKYFQRTYDPKQAAIERKKTMPRHVEYCRRPEYKAYKQGYDRVYRAKQDYGQFWEHFILIMDIRKEALGQQSRYEMDLERGRYNKSTKRKRDYAKLNSNQLETSPLGNFKYA